MVADAFLHTSSTSSTLGCVGGRDSHLLERGNPGRCVVSDFFVCPTINNARHIINRDGGLINPTHTASIALRNARGTACQLMSMYRSNKGCPVCWYEIEGWGVRRLEKKSRTLKERKRAHAQPFCRFGFVISWSRRTACAISKLYSTDLCNVGCHHDLLGPKWRACKHTLLFCAA